MNRPTATPFCLAAVVLLVITYTAHYVFIQPFILPAWGLRVLPLLLFLPWLWRGHLRSHQWLGFLSLFYLVDGILIAAHPAAGPPRLISGSLIALLAVGVYCGIILHIRRSRRRRMEALN